MMILTNIRGHGLVKIVQIKEGESGEERESD